jgi:hypothetical protein
MYVILFSFVLFFFSFSGWGGSKRISGLMRNCKIIDVSMVTDVEDWEGVQGFFDGCATKATAVI